MHQIQSSVEHFVRGAEREQNRTRRVIHFQNRICRRIDELVTSLALHHRRPDVDPVAGDVYDHRQLKQERETRIEATQHRQQHHRCAAVGDLIENRAEFSRLVQTSCCVTVERVQQAADHVERGCFDVIERHVIERNHAEPDPCVADQVRHEEEDVFGHVDRVISASRDDGSGMSLCRT